MDNTQSIEAAKQHFGTVLQQQLERVERLKEEGDWVDYSKVSPIIIGMLGGDGIGPRSASRRRKSWSTCFGRKSRQARLSSGSSTD